MENLNNMVNDLLKRRDEKIKRERNEKYRKYGNIRSNLINLLEKLEPYSITYGKLRNLYDGDGYKYTTYVIGRDDKLHFLRLSYDSTKKEFVLVIELYNSYYYKLEKLLNISTEEFYSEFSLFNLNPNDTFDNIYNEVVENINKWLNKLKKEAE